MGNVFCAFSIREGIISIIRKLVILRVVPTKLVMS